MLREIGVSTADQFDALPARQFSMVDKYRCGDDASNLPQRFAPEHGWLRIKRVVSLNNGSVEVAEISRAFQLLKERHERVFRPPVLLRRSKGIETAYYVQAADIDENTLHVRCWPNGHRTRTLRRLAARRCAAIVESEFGSDSAGNFDVPILLGVIVAGD